MSAVTPGARRLRILHVGKFYPPMPGGMERVLQMLCDGEREFVEGQALVTNDRAQTEQERIGDVPVTRVASIGSIGSVRICPTFPLWMRRLAGEVIVIHEPNPLALVAHVIARPRAALAVWFHSEVVRPQWLYALLYRPFLRSVLTRASRIIVSSPRLIEYARELHGYRAKCRVIPFGIDVRRFTLDDELTARVERIRQEDSLPIVLFVGRLVPYKGADVLLRALVGLHARAIVVGDGPLRASLQRQAEQLGVGRQLTFRGGVDDRELVALYHACEIFVLPSVTPAEAFGYVQLEAMACGKPVVSTDLRSGVPWVNRHEETGLVVPPGDHDALHAALAQLLEDSTLRARLGDRARARAASEFSVERMVRGSVALYHEMEPPAQSVLAKRSLDLILAGLGLIVSSPLWALFALTIKLEDGGPVFYAQERVGLHGRRFQALKFRSMRPNAEAGVGAVQASQHDPRVTRVGRWLRATAMDELPQLWNIFRGDMSFVGPRALRPGEIDVNGRGEPEALEAVDGFHDRITVRPGLTGIAQIYAPRDVPRRQKFRYDKLYVRRRSFGLDVRLILLSFWISARGTWEARGRKF